MPNQFGQLFSGLSPQLNTPKFKFVKNYGTSNSLTGYPGSNTSTSIPTGPMSVQPKQSTVTSNTGATAPAEKNPALSTPPAKQFIANQITTPQPTVAAGNLDLGTPPPPTPAAQPITGNVQTPSGATVDATTGNPVSAAPQDPKASYRSAFDSYMATLNPSAAETAASKNLADLTLQSKKDQEEALNRGETQGFATGEAARVNRNNAFGIEAASNALDSFSNNRTSQTAAQKARLDFEKSLLPSPDNFNLSPGETRFDSEGNPIASVAPKTTDDTSQQAIDDWTQAVLGGNSTMVQVPASIRTQVAHALNTVDESGNGGSYSPLASSRYTVASNRIVNNFTQLPQYQLTAGGLPYLQRIDAAIKTPGSVSDQDLLDSLTKLNTAGNAITDAQVKIITDGKSFADTIGTFGNKFKNGGVLSENQRNQIQTIAKAIFKNYQKGYQPVYDQVSAQLKAAGIPKQFWTIPDLNTLSSGVMGDDSGNSPDNSESGFGWNG